MTAQSGPITKRLWLPSSTGWWRVGPVGWVWSKTRPHFRAVTVGVGRWGRTWNRPIAERELPRHHGADPMDYWP